MEPKVIRPETAADLADAIAGAARTGEKLAIRGGGSKAEIGAPTPDATWLEMGGFDSIVDYDPAELVLTVGAATPLRTVTALLAERGQALVFDPFDHGPLFGRASGMATMGGIVAAAVAGSHRLSQGGARDHLLGFRAVSGRSEHFLAGAKVVKNVTGYDLPKLAAGSWGRLFAMTELTLKVLPAPPESATLVIEGLSPATAVATMARALGSHADVTAAAHSPGRAGRAAETLFQVRGVGPAVEARCDMLRDIAPDGYALRIERNGTQGRLWEDFRTLAPLMDGQALWRLNLRPSRAPALVAALEKEGARWMMDWAGGLIWTTWDGDAAALRSAVEDAAGHAMLVRGSASLRLATPAFHPQAAGLAALEERIRRAFDPQGVFETGRFGDRRAN